VVALCMDGLPRCSHSMPTQVSSAVAAAVFVVRNARPARPSAAS